MTSKRPITQVTVLSALHRPDAEPKESVDKAVLDLRSEILAELEAFVPGAKVIVHALEDEKIAACLGCFDCWTKTPGVCRIRDDANPIANDLIDSELVVYLAPITFGGWCASMKQAIDRTLGLIAPFFQMQEGEVHHKKRYDHYPQTLAIGVLDDEAPEGWARTFATLMERNAVNFHSENLSVVVHPSERGDQRAEKVLAALTRLREDDFTPQMRHFESLETRLATDVYSPPEGCRPLVLVGSSRPEDKSTSERLGRELTERLHGIGMAQAEILRLNTLLARDDQGGAEKLLAAVDRCDLLILASPLYIDALPATMVKALDLIAEGIAGDVKAPLGVAGLLNCGFPEAEQTFLAVDIMEHFAVKAGIPWLGALSLGGGESIHGRTFEEVGGAALHVGKALDLAAADLGEGRPISGEAVRICAKLMLPKSLYVLMGGMGWRQQAWRQGAFGHLSDRPFEDAH
jgi:multimeric flavodoxin WrbA